MRTSANLLRLVIISGLLLTLISLSNVALAQNNPPVLLGPLGDLVFPGPGVYDAGNQNGHFSDPDGDPLDFFGSSADETVARIRIDIAGNTAIIVPAGASGTTLITITATDPSGASASGDFNVTVFGIAAPTHVVAVTNTSDVVNGNTASISDLIGFNGGDGVSLREALMAANATPNDVALDSIHFKIPGIGPHTIQPLSQLPDITDPVVIDGYTQPGSSPNTNGWGMGLNTVLMVELDGSLAGAGATGLVIRETSGCVVRGLVLNSWANYAVNPLGATAVGTRIEGNFVGTDPSGTTSRSNQNGGVLSQGNSTVIGGRSPATRNLLSGSHAGITESGSSTRILGNLIGTDISGTASVPNTQMGINVQLCSDIVIGEPEAGNVISGNSRWGVIGACGHGSTTIQANYIGTDVTGETPLGNGDSGIATSGIAVIGGLDPGTGNVISANHGAGLFYSGLGSAIIQGNYIGTNANGTVLLENSGTGISMQEANGHLIGGATPEARNIIAGGQYGISVGVGSRTSVVGNYIGTDVTGTLDFGGTGWAINVAGNAGISTDHVIGGLAPGEGNLIAGYGGGILLTGAGVTGTRIKGNSIGTAADSVAPIAMYYGVAIWSGPSQTLVEQNLIANAVYHGVQVDANSVKNTIRSNQIFNNGELGIELAVPGSAGVTANDPGDTDAGANDLQNFPVITNAVRGATSTSIQGTLNSSPNESFTLEFFANSSAHSSGYGEGERPLGIAEVVTDASGNGAFSVNLDTVGSAMTHVTATATDEEGNTSEFSAAVAFSTNTAPVAAAGGPYSGDEAAAIALDGASATDADGDALSLSWTVDSAGCSFSDASSQNPSLTCLDNGIFEVTLSADDGSGPVESSTQVQVANVAPTVESVSGPLDPVQADSVITGVSAEFSDPAGSNDAAYTCTVDYGDGTGSLAGTVTDWTCSGPSHGFTSAGVFAVQITVTDKDGGQSAPGLFQFVVVYDPGAGFVSGAGLIDSPPGAFAADPGLSGKARFGFVSKYQKGASTPSGQTIFKFNVADLSFESYVYQWLVVAGPNAKFKGTGSINDEGNYGFMITATDEKLTASTDKDLFRIKIWNKDAGDAVVYDNQMGDSDDSDAATPIVGGNIVIHTTGKGATAKSNGAPPILEVPADYALFQNYPNPFNPSTRIEYALPEKSFVRLTVFDALGRLVAELLNQEIPAGSHSSDWDARQLGSGVYFYRLEAGDFVATRSMFLAQ